MNVDLSRRRVLALGALPVAGTLAGSAFVGSSMVAATAPRPHPQAVTPGASAFVSVPPSRLADTRPEGIGGYTRLDANTIRVVVGGRGSVPNSSSAAVLNVTAVNTVTAGYITVYPAGSARPKASNVNIERAGQIIPNLVTVRLGMVAGADGPVGAVDIFTQSPCDLVVDVNGAYTPVADAVAAGRFVALAAAARVLDTRDSGAKVGGGTTIRVNCASAVPAGATAVVVNLTVTETNSAGFWTAFPAGSALPTSSNVNTDAAGQTRANQAILPVGVVSAAIRGIDVFSSSGGHLIVDVAGYFTGSGSPVAAEGLFVPRPPDRVLDTRETVLGRMYPGWIAEFWYSNLAQSQAVVVNLTATETRGVGFFTGYPARTNRPLASNLNASAKDQTVANHAILRASTVGVAVFTQSGAALIVDVAGYFIGQPSAAPLPAPVNIVPPPPPPAPLPYELYLPRINQVNTVYEGVGKNVVDNGFVGHWPGTGLAGEQSHIVLFAHRTEHGGVWRYMHTFVPGDLIYITAADGRVFTYQYARRDITGSGAAEIYNVGLQAALPSLSLVGCSKTNTLPTDTRYRLVVTFTLIAES